MVLDTKGEEAFDQWKPFTKIKDINKVREITVYRPNQIELFDDDILDQFLLLGYNMPVDCIVYIDELTSLTDSPKAKPGLLSLFSRGRSHKVKNKVVRTTAIGSTQAPFFVPRVVYRQSTRFAVFRLNDENDRKTIARFTHPRLREVPPGKHSFWYFEDDWTMPIPSRLKVA